MVRDYERLPPHGRTDNDHEYQLRSDFNDLSADYHRIADQHDDYCRAIMPVP